MISRLTTASASAVYASRTASPLPTQDSLPAGWLAFAGRELNPLDRDRKVSVPTSILLSRAYPDASWAHARRKFHEIHVIHASPTTTEALARIGALYAIEEEIRGKPADLRLSVRQARARPLLDELRIWMEKSLRSLSAKSETAGAIRYALSRWRALTRYTDDGMLEIDNSAAERALRAVALGRKNFLFAGSDCGGERAAAMYTLLGSAKLNGLNPELYLRTVLARIADHPINQIHELLPWHLAAALQTDSSRAA